MACRAAFKNLSPYTTLVFVNSKANERAQLPEKVRSAFFHEDCGRYIPKVVVMSDDLETCVTRFRYEEWKTPNKVVEKLQAAVK